jgi:hypothetical protein
MASLYDHSLHSAFVVVPHCNPSRNLTNETGAGGEKRPTTRDALPGIFVFFYAM